MFKFGVIGLGNIGGAILSAALKSGLYSPADIICSDPSEEKKNAWRENGVTVADTNREAAKNAPLVLLAVKPQQAREVAAEIAPVSDGVCFVSIMAGIKSSVLKEILPPSASVIPVMPNTPLIIGKAATVVAHSPAAPPEMFRAAVKIFEACGEVTFLDEDKLNAVIALSSSSPALFYRLVEVMLKYADGEGIPLPEALSLIINAGQGALEMLRVTGKTPSELTAQVTSKGGTTLAALDALSAGNFDELWLSALNACKSRADELSKS